AARDKQLATQLTDLRTRYEADARFAESFIARDVVLGYAFTHVVHEGQPRESGVLPPPLELTGETLDSGPWLAASGFTGNLPELQANAAAAGFFDTPTTDEDATIRRLPLLQQYKGRIYESLDLTVARLAQKGAPIQLGFERRSGRQQLEFIAVGER